MAKRIQLGMVPTKGAVCESWDYDLIGMMDYHLQRQPLRQPILPQRAPSIDVLSYMGEWPDDGYIPAQRGELKIRWPGFDRDAYQKLVSFLDQAMPTSSIRWDFEWNNDTLLIQMVGIGRHRDGHARRHKPYSGTRKRF